MGEQWESINFKGLLISLVDFWSEVASCKSLSAYQAEAAYRLCRESTSLLIIWTPHSPLQVFRCINTSKLAMSKLQKVSLQVCPRAARSDTCVSQQISPPQSSSSALQGHPRFLSAARRPQAVTCRTSHTSQGSESLITENNYDNKQWLCYRKNNLELL